MRDWLEPLTKSAIVISGLYVFAAYLIGVDRALAGHGRGAGNLRHTGMDRLIRPLRDGLRMFFGEFVSGGGDWSLSIRLGAVTAMTASLVAFATIPFGSPLPAGAGLDPIALMIAPGIDVGVLLVLAMLGVGFFGVAAAAREPLPFGRCADTLAEGVTYGLAVIGVVAFSGSLRLDQIVTEQARQDIWWIALQPLGCAGFGLCLLSRVVRVESPVATRPDEANEHQLPGPFPSGLMSLIDALHVIALVYLFVILFLGGWHLWGVSPAADASRPTWQTSLMCVAILHVKVMAVVAWLIWFRRTRLRGGTVKFLRQAWTVAVPMGLLGLAVTFVTLAILDEAGRVTQAGVAWGALVLGLPTLAAMYRKFAGE